MRFDAKMRALAHHVVDALFDHVENVESRPVVDWRTSSELREIVRQPGDARAQVRKLTDYAIQLHHPMYIGHQVCPPFPSAVIADLVISTLNQSTAVFEMSPIGTVIEQEIVRWLADLAGYPVSPAARRRISPVCSRRARDGVMKNAAIARASSVRPTRITPLRVPRRSLGFRSTTW
jgi:hypothetical protein